MPITPPAWPAVLTVRHTSTGHARANIGVGGVPQKSPLGQPRGCGLVAPRLDKNRYKPLGTVRISDEPVWSILAKYVAPLCRISVRHTRGSIAAAGLFGDEVLEAAGDIGRFHRRAAEIADRSGGDFHA